MLLEIFSLVALAIYGFEPVSLRYFKLSEDGTLHFLEHGLAPDTIPVVPTLPIPEIAKLIECFLRRMKVAWARNANCAPSARIRGAIPLPDSALQTHCFLHDTIVIQMTFPLLRGGL